MVKNFKNNKLYFKLKILDMVLDIYNYIYIYISFNEKIIKQKKKKKKKKN